MTIEQAAPILDSLREQVYAALNNVPREQQYKVYENMMRVMGSGGQHADKVKAMQDIVATLDAGSVRR
jgi:hypothetical protein